MNVRTSERWTSANVPAQTGRTAVVTGANIGLGFKTARILCADRWVPPAPEHPANPAAREGILTRKPIVSTYVTHPRPGPRPVASLKQQPGQDILLYGSATLMHTLMGHGLVDEYRLWVHPVVAGGGQRLFHDSTQMTFLQRTAVTPFSSGATILYQPATDRTEGSSATSAWR